MMVRPASLSLFNCSNSSSVSCGVKTAVGSSKINSFTSRYSAFKISTFCFFPTDKSLTAAVGSTSNRNRSESALVISTAFFRSRKPFFFGSFPNTIFSATVRDGTSLKCWCTIPIPSRRASLEEAIFTVFPSSCIVPSSGCWVPNRIFISVDFPAPFSPISA